MTLDESVAYALETSIDELAPHDHAAAMRPMTRARCSAIVHARRPTPEWRQDRRPTPSIDGPPDPGVVVLTCANCGAGDGRAEVQADLPLRLLPVLLGLLLTRSGCRGPAVGGPRRRLRR